MAQAPFTGGPIAVPGTIQAENYDTGGEGVAYHDTTPTNLGGSYRKDAVDIRAAGTGHVVGNIQAGEWLEYTVNVATAGTYRIDARVASDYSGGTFHISIDGSDKTGEITVKKTGGWDTYTTLSKSGVALAGGRHVLRITFDTAAKKGQDIANLDFLKLTNTSGTGTTPTSFSPKPLTWKSLATNPQDREEAQSFVYNGKLYELGGFVNNFQASLQVDVYNPTTNKWTRMHDMPYPVTHAAVSADPDGHDFWFVGGFKGSFTFNSSGSHGPPATSDVYKYNAATDTWTKAISLPGAHAAGGGAIVNDKLYFFGGVDKNNSSAKDLSDAWVLDLSHQSAGWKRMADFPNPRNHVGGIAVNGMIYAIGGQHHVQDDSAMVSEVDRYNPATNTWTKVASLPVAESHFNASTVLYDRYIITVGGENPHNNPLPYVFAYDTVLNKWAKLTSLPSARRAGVAGVIGNTLFQSTGYNSRHHETGTTYSADLSNVFT